MTKEEKKALKEQKKQEKAAKKAAKLQAKLAKKAAKEGKKQETVNKLEECPSEIVSAERPVAKKQQLVTPSSKEKEPNLKQVEKNETKVEVKKPEEKPAQKAVTAPAASSDTPVEKKEVKNRNYHVSLRKDDGKWQVKYAGGEKAIKLFNTQKEAIDYAQSLAKSQDGCITIHKVDGTMRKQDYSKK